MTRQVKTVALALLLAVAGVANAMPTGTMPAKKDPDPWQTMKTVMSQQGMDTTMASVRTYVGATRHSSLLYAYKKAMNVEECVFVSNDSYLGDYICAILNAKYSKKKGEKWEYLKVQYSAKVETMHSFLMSYPQSKYADEIRSKADCLKTYSDFCMVYDMSKLDAVCKKYPDDMVCPYEGYARIAETINQWKSDWNDWQRISHSSGMEDFEVYEVFADSHPNTCSVLKYVSCDSVRVSRERYDYRVAMEQSTVASLKNFLSQHPTSTKAHYVGKLLAEKETWEAAVKGNTHEDYLIFLQRYPQSDSAVVAKERMRQMEEPDWIVTEKTNTEASYTAFLDKWPEGYYAETAAARQLEKALAKRKMRKSNMQKMFELIAPCAMEGHSKIRIGNLSKDKDEVMTVSISGSKNEYTFKLNSGEWKTYTVPNGQYSIYVYAKKAREGDAFNSKGKLKVEDGVYQMYQYTYDLKDQNCPDSILFQRYVSKQMYKRWLSDGISLIENEMDLLEKKDDATKRTKLRSFFIQWEMEDEEFKKVYRELQYDYNLDSFIYSLRVNYLKTIILETY